MSRRGCKSNFSLKERMLFAAIDTTVTATAIAHQSVL